jgi:hypothetical protein
VLEGPLRPILLNVCTCKKIRSDHLQAISSRVIVSEHQASSFDGLLLNKLCRLAPTHLLQIVFGDSRQFFVNRHQVVGLPSRTGKAPLGGEVSEK